MPDIVRALAISGGLLLLVVILIVIISIAAVNRGAAAMGSHAEHADETKAAVKEPAAAPAAKAAKPMAPAKDEINVLQILAFGTGLFVLAVLGLFALSLIEHM
jgi:hypothetical protein